MAKEIGPRCPGLSVLRLKYGELVTPSPGRMPFSGRSDSSANHRNLESWWSAEFSAVWAYTPTEADAAAIRAAFDRGGELSAAVELRRLFPGVTDNAQARECARTIAAWKPLPAKRRLVRLPGKRR